MAETSRCARCGAELAAEVPDGLCPRCLLEQAVGSQANPKNPPQPSGSELPATAPHSPNSFGFVAPSPESLAPHFLQFEILALLGQGGMGAVYQARQTTLDRLVAI